jgi:Glyoxalase/Bleomycin resistance protein/Dioxygenase superfamily
MDKLLFDVPLGAIMQVAYVVENIERDAARWSRLLGAGPFFHLPRFPVVDAIHRGTPLEVDIDVALAFSGGLCIELIQPNNDGPSVYRELIDRRGYGLHHWAVSTRTFDADLARYEATGVSVASSGRVVVGARVAYLDTVASLDAMIELIEITPEVEAFFAMLQGAARDWDGRNPLRLL